MTVSVEKIWQALESDPSFMKDIPPGRPVEIFREIVGRLPTALADQLAVPVTLESLLKAKQAFLRDFIAEGFTRRLIEAYPQEAFGLVPREIVAAQSQAVVEQMVPAIEEFCVDIPTWLEENGLSEEKALGHQEIGKLNETAMAEYRAGTLTVGRLLELQPAAIIKNTD